MDMNPNPLGHEATRIPQQLKLKKDLCSHDQEVVSSVPVATEQCLKLDPSGTRFSS